MTTATHEAIGLDLDPDYLDGADAAALLDELTRTLPWRQGQVRVYGKTHAEPRLTSWHGPAGYTYSGRTIDAQPETDALRWLREQLQADLGVEFNSVLANLYRDGRDSIGWHADDEPELGPEPTIASISLGAPRTFKLRLKGGGPATHAVPLTHGSLVVMRGTLQQTHEHSVPRALRITEPRINLTFRDMKR